MKLLLSGLAILIGVFVTIQSQINGTLGKKVGAIEASFASFSIGTVVLFIVVFFFGKGDLPAVMTVPKWQLAGGVLGACFVAISAYVVPKIGVATTVFAVIVGQISMGMIIDYFGLFGAQQIPITFKKIFAIVLLISAIYLFNQE